MPTNKPKLSLDAARVWHAIGAACRRMALRRELARGVPLNGLLCDSVPPTGAPCWSCTVQAAFAELTRLQLAELVCSFHYLTPAGVNALYGPLEV